MPERHSLSLTVKSNSAVLKKSRMPGRQSLPLRSLRRNFVVQMVSNGRHSQVFIIEMIMRCGKYQIVVGHSPFLTIIIIMRSKR